MMKFSFCALGVVFALIAPILSMPNDLHDRHGGGKKDKCDRVGHVVQVLQYYYASPFCSSLLCLSTKTITETETVSLPKVAPTAAVATAQTDTFQPTIVPRVAVAAPATEAGAAPAKRTVDAAEALEKRHGGGHGAKCNKPKPNETPEYLRRFPAPVVSSGCSCWSLPTITATETTTTTVRPKTRAH